MPVRKKLTKPKKRQLGLVSSTQPNHFEDPIESFSQLFLNIMKNRKSCGSSSSVPKIPSLDSSEGTDRYSGGSILCCEPISDSDVRLCNFKFLNILNLISGTRSGVQSPNLE